MWIPRRLAKLESYDWPGNVRELQNYVERAVVMAEGDALTMDLLPDTVLGGRQLRRRVDATEPDFESLTADVVQQGLSSATPDEAGLHSKIVNSVERELIAQVMQACSNVQTKAATRLGINRNTLHKKLKEYDLEQ